MASPCELLLETGDAQLARQLARLAADETHRIERKFSRYRDDSIVHALHAARGTPFKVDEETARLLDFGAALWRLSEGRFDLTSGVLRRVWRFGPGNALPSAAAVAAQLANVGWQRVSWQSPWLTLPPDMEIDLGGIGKEYAVDRVADLVAARSAFPVLVNFGGDLRCVGPAPAGGAWQVGVESPDSMGAAVRAVELRAGALATSGDARRAIVSDGRRYGHILDARTGWPPPDAPRSVTVAADTCTQAGSYSTLAILQGAGAEAFLRAENVRHWCLR